MGGTRGMTASVLDETPGEEAGIKSATIQFSGENAYGLLAGETGFTVSFESRPSIRPRGATLLLPPSS